ncbi:MAG TPA: hypothetical protein PK830_06525 [Candidatus Atribacteria bacterium]|nr:hypothetical protein [Candidatus Atribacteria bacterium]
MIFRNSLKSVLRTPVKTVLSVLLISAVTAFLCLSSSTWAASVAMLRDRDEACTTIVTMEYLEDAGAYIGTDKEAMLADIAGIDFDAIASNKNVLLWQPSDVTVGIVDGYAPNSKGNEESNYCVLLVTELKRSRENGPFTGKLVETLYSAREYNAGRTIFVYENSNEGIELDPDPDATYVIHGYNMGLYSYNLEVR